MQYHDQPHSLRNQFDEAADSYAALRAAEAALQSYAGSLYWRKQEDGEFLDYSDRLRKTRRLGKRSSAMEAIYAAFIAGRQHAREHYKELTVAMKRQQRLNRVLRVGHVPTPWIRILNGVHDAGMADQVTVIGVAATYAYEFAAGVRIAHEAGNMVDAAMLAERRSRLQLMVRDAAAAAQLLGVIQLAVPTCHIDRHRDYCAVDARGLEVLVQLQAANGPDHLQMLFNAPAFVQHVVGINGEMASMRAYAPRSFALHRLILANQSGRNALDRRYHLNLARLVMEMVRERLEPAGDSDLPTQFMTAQGPSWPANSMNISA